MTALGFSFFAAFLASTSCAVNLGTVSNDEPFTVVFDVSLGGDTPKDETFIVQVLPEWAPKGAAQFKSLVERGWYDGAAIFRVVPGFVAQFGLPAKPAPALESITDDPVKASNERGTLVFATSGPDTRTSQLFINYGDNAFLDSQGFAPIGKVVGEGMKVIDNFYAGYGEDPNQGEIRRSGNDYVDARFPKISKIAKCAIKN